MWHPMALADECTEERCYSLVGVAVDRGRREYRIAVAWRAMAGGCRRNCTAFSTLTLRPRAVRLRRPAGRFLLPVRPSRPVVLLAAESASRPSWATGVWAADPGSLRQPVLLVHGSRNPAEEPYSQRLAQLATALPGLERIVFHSSGRGSARTGRLEAGCIEERWQRERATFHVCGPDAMAREVIAGWWRVAFRATTSSANRFSLRPTPRRPRPSAA